MTREEIRNTYAELAGKHESELSELKRRQFLISLLRLLIFIGGGIIAGLAFTYSAAAGIIVLLLSITLFLFLVREFIRHSEQITIAENLIKINIKEINALDGDYPGADNGMDLNPPDHDYANDIDLFGEGSLFGYINRTVSGPGRLVLARTLLNPEAVRQEISERQTAIKELSGRLLWRQKFAAYGIDRRLDEDEIRSLDNWLNEKEDLLIPEFLRIIFFVLPVSAAIVLLFVIAGTLPFQVFLILFLMNLFLEGIFIKKINRIHELVSRKHTFLSSLEKLIRMVDSESFSSSVLLDIKEKLCSDKGAVAENIRELDKIIRAFDSRLNMIVGVILNGLLLWDFHCIMRLEKWRQSVASSLPVWLGEIGEMDALNSFANYAFNNPDYVYPATATDKSILQAMSMGHPLLPAGTRVSNDFSIDRRGQVYIITGANMAGKSTFLRTVAVNILLASSGAPVCAKKMTFSPVKLFTSMRTTDSLSRNESYFYAELKRLRTLKEKIEGGEEYLFILDEILKGTNSTDKSTGSRIYLTRLIGSGATGLIATHDISLGEMEAEFPGRIINKCFEIEIEGDQISFDYILRDGITRKMNASLLMKQMGIV